MNLWEGTLTTESGGHVFHNHGLTLPLPASLRFPPATPRSAVTLGIRPEDIALRETPRALQLVTDRWTSSKILERIYSCTAGSVTVAWWYERPAALTEFKDRQ
jgi:hypothetical protein